MIYTGLNRTGEIETIKTHGGGEIAEVYGGINYQNPIFYSRKTITGTSPLTFKALGQPLKDYHIFGETVQNGTPSPDYPVDVQGVGEWDATVQQYKIPVTIGNVTTPIYIGSDPLYRIGDYADEIDFANQQIIRRIKKVIINGTESMTAVGPYGGGKYKLRYRGIANSGICSGKEKDTHFRTTTKNMDGLLDGEMSFIGISSRYVDFCKDTTMRSLQNWRDYFAEQYSAGTPVIIPYVLATPTTESVTIPTLTTITGDNALSIGTTIQPSAVSITGNIKPTGYGQLLDVNDVDIQDSTGEPIYIQG